MVDTILITFLGRTPKQEKGRYRTTCYDFGDGGDCESLAFFGWALQRRLRPKRLVILGTAGSMWDHLFEGDLDFGDVAEDERLALAEAVELRQVEQASLDRLAPVLVQQLGCEVRLRLISHCRTEEEQVVLLRELAEEVEPGARVDLDVTHGFRHLPMLGLLSALHLRKVRDAQIGNIWYGAYDPDTKEAPVMRLSGLLRIADWLEALAIYHHSGDYGPCAPLLGDNGHLLREAAFFERTGNPVRARQCLNSWAGRARQDRPGDAITPLFLPELEHRVHWYRGFDRADWECSLAWIYLDKSDYLRAASYAQEGAISNAVAERGGDLNDYDARESARLELRDSLDGFKRLSSLRNAMAHGVRPTNRDILRILADEATLKDTLKSLFIQVIGRPR